MKNSNYNLTGYPSTKHPKYIQKSKKQGKVKKVCFYLIFDDCKLRMIIRKLTCTYLYCFRADNSYDETVLQQKTNHDWAHCLSLYDVEKKSQSFLTDSTGIFQNRKVQFFTLSQR